MFTAKASQIFGFWILVVGPLVACSSGDLPGTAGGSAGSSSEGGRGNIGDGGNNRDSVDGSAGSGGRVDGQGGNGQDGRSAGGGSESPGTGGASAGSIDGGSDAMNAGRDGGAVSDAKLEDAAFAGESGAILPDAGANLVSLFDGTTLNGWVQLPAASWSVENGAMHSLGTARGVIYTTQTYGDFRLVFTSRLISDPANHNPCVLFWGNSLTMDALAASRFNRLPAACGTIERPDPRPT